MVQVLLSARLVTWVYCLATLSHLPGFDGQDRSRLSPPTFLLGFVEGVVRVVLALPYTAPLAQVVVNEVESQVNDLLQVTFQSQQFLAARVSMKLRKKENISHLILRVSGQGGLNLLELKFVRVQFRFTHFYKFSGIQKMVSGSNKNLVYGV